MRLKYLTTGIAATAIVGAAAAGVTSVAIGASSAAPAVTPVVFDIPLPLEPPIANVPDDAELTGILTTLADPSLPFSAKGYLVEDGVGPIEGTTADKLLKNAAAKGYLPLAFAITQKAPSAQGVTATVVASGPQLAGTTQQVTFVNPAGTWQLSRGSATALLQAALASG